MDATFHKKSCWDNIHFRFWFIKLTMGWFCDRIFVLLGIRFLDLTGVVFATNNWEFVMGIVRFCRGMGHDAICKFHVPSYTGNCEEKVQWKEGKSNLKEGDKNRDLRFQHMWLGLVILDMNWWYYCLRSAVNCCVLSWCIYPGAYRARCLSLFARDNAALFFWWVIYELHWRNVHCSPLPPLPPFL